MGYFHSPRIVTNGLVLYLDAGNRKSYPGAGTVWRDLSGNGNNGTLTNGPTFNSANGGGIVFDGVNDYVRIPNAINFIPSQNITILGWQYLVKRDSTFIMCSDGLGNNEILIYNGWDSLISRKIGVAFNAPTGTSSWLLSNTEPSLNTWMYIAVTRESNTVSLYINGQLETVNTQAGLIIPGNTAPLLIGVDVDSGDEGSLGNWFNGNIPQILIYNRALSTTEILQNFNATKGRYDL
jgi:hypothetical protein